RYRFDHADADHRQRPREIPDEVDDLAAFDADRGLKLVARDHRARVGRDHFDLDAEIEQLLLDQPRSELERVRADHLVRSLRFVEQGQRGQQRIGQVLEQRDLLLALDARRFGYLGRRRLDADRLVDLQLLLADLDYFLALDDRLYPRAPVLPFLPAALRKEIRGLAPGTHPLDDREPRYSAEQAEPRGEQQQEDERAAGESQRVTERAAHDRPQDPAGGLRQGRLQAVEAQRLQAAAGDQHHREADRHDGVRPAIAFHDAFDAAESPPDGRPAERHPPVRGEPEQVKHDIRDPGADAAASIVNDGRVARAVRP